jgi:hypothetical protein
MFLFSYFLGGGDPGTAARAILSVQQKINFL